MAGTAPLAESATQARNGTSIDSTVSIRRPRGIGVRMASSAEVRRGRARRGNDVLSLRPADASESRSATAVTAASTIDGARVDVPSVEQPVERRLAVREAGADEEVGDAVGLEVEVVRCGARGERLDVLLPGEDRGSGLVGLVVGLADPGALRHDRDRRRTILLDPLQGVEPGIHQRLNVLRLVLRHLLGDHEVIRDRPGELGRRGDRTAARTLKGRGSERGEGTDGIDLTGDERGGRGVGEQRNQLDVLIGQPGFGQSQLQEVMVHGALLDRDLRSPQVGDAVDPLPGDDLVVAC